MHVYVRTTINKTVNFAEPQSKPQLRGIVLSSGNFLWQKL